MNYCYAGEQKSSGVRNFIEIQNRSLGKTLYVIKMNREDDFKEF